MHIFIDESGGFQPSPTKTHSISCVGAAIIPGRHLAKIEDGFLEITKDWPKSENGEIKGRLLDEVHIAELCKFLEPFHVLFETCVVDLNLMTDGEIDYHKSKQAEGMTKNLTDDFHPNFVAEVWELRHLLEKMPRQLYVQSVSLKEVVVSAFQEGTLYFCQRYPGELGRFRWVIDAKESGKITDYEEWWRLSVMPLIQSRSLREPMAMLKGGDYSAYRRNFPMVEMSEHLRTYVDKPEQRATNLNAIFKEIEFASSEMHVGLQIVDVLTNALRRALSERLQPEGWLPLGMLTIKRKKGSIQIISLGQGPDQVKARYARIIKQFDRSGRSMVVTK